jgi:hypothetical protein
MTDQKMTDQRCSFTVKVNKKVLELTHRSRTLRNTSALLHWGSAENMLTNQPLFCMMPKRRLEYWRGKRLLTLRTKRPLRLWKNYGDRNGKHRYFMERPDEVQLGSCEVRQAFLDQLKIYGYDGWYGPLNYSSHEMEFLIRNPNEVLEICDIVTYEPKIPRTLSEIGLKRLGTRNKQPKAFHRGQFS